MSDFWDGITGQQSGGPSGQQDLPGPRPTIFNEEYYGPEGTYFVGRPNDRFNFSAQIRWSTPVDTTEFTADDVTFTFDDGRVSISNIRFVSNLIIANISVSASGSVTTRVRIALRQGAIPASGGRAESPAYTKVSCLITFQASRPVPTILKPLSSSGTALPSNADGDIRTSGGAPLTDPIPIPAQLQIPVRWNAYEVRRAISTFDASDLSGMLDITGVSAAFSFSSISRAEGVPTQGNEWMFDSRVTNVLDDINSDLKPIEGREATRFYIVRERDSRWYYMRLEAALTISITTPRPPEYNIGFQFLGTSIPPASGGTRGGVVFGDSIYVGLDSLNSGTISEYNTGGCLQGSRGQVGSIFVPSTITAIGSKLYGLNSVSAPTQIRAVTGTRQSGFTRSTADDITLSSGAGTTALGRMNLLSNGTFIWVCGISSNRQTLYCYAYRASNQSRASAFDITYTTPSSCKRIKGVTSDGTDIYAIHDDNTIQEFVSTDFHVPLQIRRSGTAGGTGTMGISVRCGALPQVERTGAGAVVYLLPSQPASRTFAVRMLTVAPTVVMSGASVSGRTLTFRADWSEVVSGFTSADVSIDTGTSGVQVSNIRVANRSGGTANQNFVVTATLSAGTAALKAVIRAGASPSTSTREGSALTETCLGTFTIRDAGYQPAFRPRALDLAGMALPPANDGETGQPIKRAHDFIAQVVWPSAAVTRAQSEFDRCDISGTGTFTGASADVRIGLPFQLLQSEAYAADDVVTQGGTLAGFGDLDDNRYPISWNTGDAGKFFLISSTSSTANNGQFLEYTLGGGNPVLRGVDRNAASDRSQAGIHIPSPSDDSIEHTYLVLDRFIALWRNNLTWYRAGRDLPNTYATSDAVRSLTSDGTNFYVLNSLTAPTVINAFTIARSGGDLNYTAVSGSNITLASGAGVPSGSVRARLLVVGDTMWVGSLTSNRQTANLYAYTISTRARNSGLDITYTHSGGIKAMFTDGIRIFFIRDDNRIQPYRHIPAGDNTVWYVPVQVERTSAAGATGSIDLDVRAGALQRTSARDPSQAASAGFAFQLQGAPLTACIGNARIFTRGSTRFITFNVDWSGDTGGSFTSDDVVIASSQQSLMITNITVAARTGGTAGQDFTVTAQLSSNLRATFWATVEDSAIPATDTREASALTSQVLGTFGQASLGYQPTFGTALTSTGCALPSTRNGTSATQPITQRETFQAVVFWTEAAAQTQAATAFTKADLSASIDFGMASPTPTASVEVGDPVRQGTTSQWRVPITVTRSGTVGGLAEITLSVRAGALPATAARVASQSAEQIYHFRMQQSAPTFTLGSGSRSGNVYTFNLTWSSNIGSEFCASDFTLRSSNAAVTLSNVVLRNRPAGRAGQDFQISVTLSSSAATVLSIVMNAAAIPATDTREASARRVATVANIGALQTGHTPVIGDWRATATGSTSTGTIQRTLTFYSWIDWPAVVAGFDSSDVNVIVRGMSGVTGTASIANRSGGTAGRNYLLTVQMTSTRTSTCTGMVEVSIPAGAVPAAGTRAASLAASKEFTLQVQAPGPTLQIGAETLTGGTISFPITFSENITASDFTAADCIITASSGSIDVGAVSVARSTTGGDTTGWTVSATVQGNDTSTLTLAVRRNAIPETNERLGSPATDRTSAEYNISAGRIAGLPKVIAWDVPDEPAEDSSQDIEVLVRFDRNVRKPDGTPIDSSVFRIEGLTGIEDSDIVVTPITASTADADALKLRVYCLPTTRIANGASFAFRVVVVGCPLAHSLLTGAISVSAGTVTHVCNTRAGREFQFTVMTPATGSGDITITAVQSGAFTNLAGDLVIGTVSYGSS